MRSPHESRRTRRLDLQALTAADVDAMYELHTDPRVWRHFPSGRHVDRRQTATFVAEAVRNWAAVGLDYWAVRTRLDLPGGPRAGSSVGVAGVPLRRGPVWNLYYRFAPAVQGLGLASEAAEAALEAAAEADPGVPVMAYLLEHNTASRRTAERVGLQLVWRGPDHGNPDPEAVRLVYADRPVSAELLSELTGRP